MSAKDMIFGSNYQFDNKEQQSYAREDLIYNTTEDLLVIMEDRSITKQELARRLGKSRAFITQLLNGSRNMTLRTLSDICFVLGVTPRVMLPTHQSPKSQYPWEVIEKTEAKPSKATVVKSNNIILRQNASDWKREEAA